MTRLLITGGSGLVGARLCDIAREGGWDVWATYCTRALTAPQTLACDLSDFDSARRVLAESRADVVIHTACSNRTPAQIAAIAPAARHLAQLTHENNLRFIHLSTDLVFDGEHPPYADDSPPAPIMPYGRAKAEAEQIIGEIYPAAIIVRPALIWSLDPLDHQNRWIVESARNGAPITLFTDEYRTPVYLPDLCAALLELAARPDLGGVMNLVGPQFLNRWDFGHKILAHLGVPAGPGIRSGTVAESGLVRARNVSLLAQRAQRELKTKLRGVDEVLAPIPGPSPVAQTATGEGSRTRRPRYCEE